MTVGELRKILAGEDDDTLLVNITYRAGDFYITKLDKPYLALTDGRDTFPFDESKIDPGHMWKVMVLDG